MPAALIALILGGMFLLSRKQANAATPAQLPAPDASAYMPPIAAPDWARMAYANAAASRDPIAMVQTAKLLMDRGQLELARALSAQYQQLTNQPIPGVGWYSAGARPPAMLPAWPSGLSDPRMQEALKLLLAVRRERERRAVLRLMHALRLSRTA